MNPEKFRRAFLSRVGDYRPFLHLLDLLPDVAFFMKDRDGRFVMHNRRSCEYCHVGSEAETLGKTDYDFFPKDRAKMYVEGDQQVMQTGEPIINAIAPAPEEAGSDRLIVYSKVPVKDRRGHIIGIAGIHREIEGLRAAPKTFGRLSQAVQLMHQKFSEPLSTPELAKMARLSRSQFDRHFRHLFGTTPREYLLRVRINAACRLLADTDRKTTDIALQTGFCDHSHFSRTFCRIMGTSPTVYRKHHAPE
ncbi:MAG TPA: helix-turn-helix domain-containing protein [Planctomycetota bacterium]|jgi:AraC-like DNA-binding protein